MKDNLRVNDVFISLRRKIIEFNLLISFLFQIYVSSSHGLNITICVYFCCLFISDKFVLVISVEAKQNFFSIYFSFVLVFFDFY